MFCPKCATQNLEGASFCRACGANISLVPQALTGQIPQQAPDEFDSRASRRKRRHGREPSLDQAFKNIFMGIAFLVVAIALANSIGRGWWFWMLLPAFSMMGTGVAQYIRLKEMEKRNSLAASRMPGAFPPNQQPTPPPRQVYRRNTGELMPPVPSVTEGTTRHLGKEAATRHLDQDEQK